MNKYILKEPAILSFLLAGVFFSFFPIEKKVRL